MNVEHIHPYVRYADKTYRELNFEHPIMAQDCRLFFTLDGQHTLSTADETYHIRANDIVYIPHSVPYQSEYSSPFSQIKVNFDFNIDRKNASPTPFPILKVNSLTYSAESDHLSAPYNKVIVLQNCGHYRGIFEEIKSQMLARRTDYNLVSAALVKSVIAYINQNIVLGSNRTNALVDATIKYIHDNYMEQITNESISDALNYHHIYINRQFKLATSLSIHQYLINYRCEMAKKLLETTFLSVRDIAFDVGFQSAAHFSAIFKKTTGISPLNYRKNMTFLL